MKVISVIEDEDVIKKILKHLGLWDQKARPPPKANTRSMAQEYHIDYNDSQVPLSDNWLYVDPQYPETYTAWFFKKELGSRDRSTQIPSISSPFGMIKPPGAVSASTPLLGSSPHFTPDSYAHNIL